MIIRLTLSKEGTVHEYTFRRREILIGSSQRVDLCVPLDGVPLRLARMRRIDGHVWLEGLRAGTTMIVDRPSVGRIESSAAIGLHPGDRVVLAATDGGQAEVELVSSGEDLQNGPSPAVLFSLSEPAEESPFLAVATTRLALELTTATSALEVCAAVGRLAEAVERDCEAIVVLAPTGNVLPADLERLGNTAKDPIGPECRQGIAKRLHEGKVVALQGQRTATILPIFDGTRTRGYWSVSSAERPDVNALRAVAGPVSGLVLSALDRIKERWELRVTTEENRYFRSRERRHYLFKELVTNSKAMAALYEQVHAMTEARYPILIIGEKGTGKEMIGRALHHLSDRGSSLMISQNCASRSESELDHELFGWSDDEGSARGLLELTQGGTLFLDRIERLPPRLQTKLLRAIVEREVRPEGDTVGRPVEVRLVVSTEHDLFPLVEQGEFRRDLYLQLCQHTLTVPPLRDRLEDVEGLANVFVAQFAGVYGKAVERVSEAVSELLRSQPWHGNVRELQNLIELSVIRVSPDSDVLDDVLIAAG